MVTRKATDMLIADHRQVVKEINDFEEVLVDLEYESAARARISSMADFINKDINNHFLKEEKHLFPILEDIPGMIEGPLKLIKYEHDEYWNISLKFQELAERWLFKELSKEDHYKLVEIGEALISLLRAHIDKEDNVLFPMVEHYLDNDTLWETAEKIRFTAGPIETESNLIVMDIRSAKTKRRQQVVIDTFNQMELGKEIKIINNNRLSHLHDKFEIKCRGRYAWRIDEEGPKRWVAMVKKVA